MDAYISFDRHIYIGNNTLSEGVITQIGYQDINDKIVSEIVNNPKIKYIQISEYLPNEAYRIIDKILNLRNDITFRLFHFWEYDKIDISFLLNMSHIKRLSIDCIDFKKNPERINLELLSKIDLKTLRIECFDLRDYSFI